jgi:hypothetical protein
MHSDPLNYWAGWALAIGGFLLAVKLIGWLPLLGRELLAWMDYWARK